MTAAISQGIWWNPGQPGCIVLGPPFIILGPSFPPDQSTNDGDYVSGNQGDDHLVGGAGNDRLDGYQGNDTLDGGDGDDHLDGYQDDNLLIGGNGNDTLTGGSGGHHTLQGGAGDDVYETTNGYFYDISDTSGTDTVEFVWGLNQLTGLYRVGSSTPGTPGNDLLLRFGGTDVLIRNYFVLGENGGHIENLKIRDFAVHAPDAFVTWQLQDVLSALNNPQPPLEDEYIYGTDGNDVIDGGSGDDYLNGHGGNDTLIGGDGNDTLNGHADHDTLMGGKGDDIYQSSFLTHPDPFGGTETEVIADTGGTDTVQLIGVNPTGCRFFRSEEDDLIISFGNGNSLTIQGYFTEGPDSGYIENLDFGGSIWHMADVLQVAVVRCGTPLPPQDPPIVDLPDLIVYNPVEGTEGADTLRGSELRDFINGFGGDDVLEGAYDDDILMGGTGNDTLAGGMGADTLLGGVGHDVYEMAGSADLVANGGDVIDDEGGNDTLHIGWGGPSEILGMAKIGDDLHLSFGNGMLCVVSNLKIKNYFTSSGHIEKIAFNDETVWSLADINARLSFEPSTPQDPGISDPLPPSQNLGGIISPVDIDSPEVFSFASARAAGLGKTRSMIDHFEHGIDTIDLSGIDANTKVGGNNAFKALLTGKKPFSKAGQLHYDKKTGILSGNTDKDAAAEFQIQLKNQPDLLKLSDFVL